MEWKIILQVVEGVKKQQEEEKTSWTGIIEIRSLQLMYR